MQAGRCKPRTAQAGVAVTLGQRKRGFAPQRPALLPCDGCWSACSDTLTAGQPRS